jgi:signal transduction histidine kinase
MDLRHLNRQRTYRWFRNSAILLFFLWVNFFPLVLFAAESPLQTIFVLHSYHRGYQWTDDQNAGIEATIRDSVDQNHIYVEYMDAGRMSYEKDFSDLYLAYKRKYRGLEFDVICVTDADALDFMLRYRDRLFPRTPVVFSGVTYIDEACLRGVRGFTGVSPEPDLAANMELILRLHPKTKVVMFVNEWTTKGRLLHEEFLKIIPVFEKSLSFHLLEDADTKDILKIIGNTPDSVIFYGVFGQDKVGRVFDHKEIIDIFSRNSIAPIYSPWDFNLGLGIVGGVMTTGYSQGNAAGKQALRLLRGGRVEYMPVTKASLKQYMFDYNLLSRFNIRRDQLPAGSVIINYPESFYEKYKKYVITVVSVIAFLLIAISVLLLNIRFRHRTEKELKASREKLRALGWRLAEVEDKERKNLSRELHDQVGQNLTLLGVNLNLLRSLIPKDASELVQSKINDSLAVIRQTTQRIRNVMGNLRSPVLDDYGLVAAISHYGKQWAEGAGIDVQVRGPKTGPKMDPQAENALFRIVQEALTNVVKHANATEVIVTVRHSGGKLSLSVEDNGAGFDELLLRKMEGTHGWGMTNMRERALAVGGSFRVRSSPGLGTHVLVELQDEHNSSQE